jgi:hypothetical protein
MTADTTAVATPDLDKPLCSVSVASEILSSDPDTLMIYEDLGLAPAPAM